MVKMTKKVLSLLSVLAMLVTLASVMPAVFVPVNAEGEISISVDSSGGLVEYNGSQAYKGGWFRMHFDGAEAEKYDNVTLLFDVAGRSWVQFRTYTDGGVIADHGGRWKPDDNGFQDSGGGIFEQSKNLNASGKEDIPYGISVAGDLNGIYLTDQTDADLGSNHAIYMNCGGEIYIRGVRLIVDGEVIGGWGSLVPGVEVILDDFDLIRNWDNGQDGPGGSRTDIVNEINFRAEGLTPGLYDVQVVIEYSVGKNFWWQNHYYTDTPYSTSTRISTWGNSVWSPPWAPYQDSASQTDWRTGTVTLRDMYIGGSRPDGWDFAIVLGEHRDDGEILGLTIRGVRFIIDGQVGTWGTIEGQLPRAYPINFDLNNWHLSTWEDVPVYRTNRGSGAWAELRLRNNFNVIPLGAQYLTCDVEFLATETTPHPTNTNEAFIMGYRISATAGNDNDDNRVRTGSIQRQTWQQYTWDIRDAYYGGNGSNQIALKDYDQITGLAVRYIRLYNSLDPSLYFEWGTPSDPELFPEPTAKNYDASFGDEEPTMILADWVGNSGPLTPSWSATTGGNVFDWKNSVIGNGNLLDRRLNREDVYFEVDFDIAITDTSTGEDIDPGVFNSNRFRPYMHMRDNKSPEKRYTMELTNTSQTAMLNYGRNTFRMSMGQIIEDDPSWTNNGGMMPREWLNVNGQWTKSQNIGTDGNDRKIDWGGLTQARFNVEGFGSHYAGHTVTFTVRAFRIAYYGELKPLPWEDVTIEKSEITLYDNANSWKTHDGVDCINVTARYGAIFDVFRFAEKMNIPANTALSNMKVEWQYDIDNTTFPEDLGAYYVKDSTGANIVAANSSAWVDRDTDGWRTVTMYNGPYTIGDYSVGGKYADINFAYWFDDLFIRYIKITVTDGAGKTFTATWGTKADEPVWEPHDGEVTITGGNAPIVDYAGAQVIKKGDWQDFNIIFADSMGIPANTRLDDLKVEIEYYTPNREYRGSGDGVRIVDADGGEHWENGPAWFQRGSNEWKLVTVFELPNAEFPTTYTVNKNSTRDMGISGNLFCYISYIRVTVGDAVAEWGARYSVQPGATPLELANLARPGGGEWTGGWKADVIDSVPVAVSRAGDNDWHELHFDNNTKVFAKGGPQTLTVDIEFMKIGDIPGMNNNIVFAYQNSAAPGGDSDQGFDTSAFDRNVWVTKTWVVNNAFYSGDGNVNGNGNNKTMAIKDQAMSLGFAVRYIRVYNPNDTTKYLEWGTPSDPDLFGNPGEWHNGRLDLCNYGPEKQIKDGDNTYLNRNVWDGVELSFAANMGIPANYLLDYAKDEKIEIEIQYNATSGSSSDGNYWQMKNAADQNMCAGDDGWFQRNQGWKKAVVFNNYGDFTYNDGGAGPDGQPITTYLLNSGAARGRDFILNGNSRYFICYIKVTIEADGNTYTAEWGKEYAPNAGANRLLFNTGNSDNLNHWRTGTIGGSPAVYTTRENGNWVELGFCNVFEIFAKGDQTLTCDVEFYLTEPDALRGDEGLDFAHRHDAEMGNDHDDRLNTADLDRQVWLQHRWEDIELYYGNRALALKDDNSCTGIAIRYIKIYDPANPEMYLVWGTCGHAGSSWTNTVEPTCTEDGVKERRCNLCGEVLETGIADALGHNFTGPWIERTPATCAAAGLEYRTCTRCTVEETRPIAQLEHVPGEWEPGVPAATCTEAGVEVQKCTLCGEILDSRPAAALGHNFTGPWIERTPATCDAPGLEYRTCTRCTEEETRPIAQLEHIPGEWEILKAPSLLEDGIRVKYCTRVGCGAEVAREVIEVIKFGSIDGDEIAGIVPETSVDSIISDYADKGVTVIVYEADGETLRETGFIGTGCIVACGDDRYTAIIPGDVSGDGDIDIFDLSALLKHLTDEEYLEGVYLKAAQLAGGGDLSIFDFFAMLDLVTGSGT
ncbi:MAG: dockerin type I repeat-containing protein [Oscillospiraceae bacterium]|nr:dockerin type I repeat-containing protein [Oscillospiraceae bacterium]